MEMAKLATQHPSLLEVVVSFAHEKGTIIGYTEQDLANLRSRVLSLSRIVGSESARSLIDLLKKLSALYKSEWDAAKSPEDKGAVRELLSAGISEAIVFRLLIDKGRKEDEIRKDASVYIDGTPINSRNIDFIWSRPETKAVEAYECKRSPPRLIQYYGGPPGDRAYMALWRGAKLYLMLTLHKHLVNQRWGVHLACITSGNREVFERDLRDKPPELTIYDRKDLREGRFPPPLPGS